MPTDKPAEADLPLLANASRGSQPRSRDRSSDAGASFWRTTGAKGPARRAFMAPRMPLEPSAATFESTIHLLAATENRRILDVCQGFQQIANSRSFTPALPAA
jgi:hypothetical protein